VKPRRHHLSVRQPDLAPMQVCAVEFADQQRKTYRAGDFLERPGKWRCRQHDTDREAGARLKPPSPARYHPPEKLAPMTRLQWLEHREARITEAACELERPYAVLVDDGVEIDVTDMPGFAQQRLERLETKLEQPLRPVECGHCPHLSRQFTHVAGEE